MVNAAQRYGELIRHPTAERARLRKPDVMGLARLPTTDRARLTGNKAQMVFVAAAPGLWREAVGFYAESQPDAFLGRGLSRSARSMGAMDLRVPPLPCCGPRGGLGASDAAEVTE